MPAGSAGACPPLWATHRPPIALTPFRPDAWAPGNVHFLGTCPRGLAAPGR